MACNIWDLRWHKDAKMKYITEVNLKFIINLLPVVDIWQFLLHCRQSVEFPVPRLMHHFSPSLSAKHLLLLVLRCLMGKSQSADTSPSDRLLGRLGCFPETFFKHTMWNNIPKSALCLSHLKGSSCFCSGPTLWHFDCHPTQLDTNRHHHFLRSLQCTYHMWHLRR